MLPASIKVLGLKDIQWTKPIAEPFDTYEANAKAKALTVFTETGIDCFADDSGLEVEALNNAPGVYSARYAGEGSTDAANVEKLLHHMQGIENRKAQFVAVIAFISNAYGWKIFRGVVRGMITEKPFGKNGFGYDPVFIPEGYDTTFGELNDAVKNRISHRAKAMDAFREFLSTSGDVRSTHQ